MKAGLIHEPTLEAMGSYMTRLSKRQQIVASNIANIDTPGYRTQDISFRATLAELALESKSALRTRRPGHEAMGEWNFAPLQPQVFEVEGLTSRADRNNVDLDRELLKLGQTSFAYSLMAQLLRMKFRTIASSIQDGRSG